MKMETAMNFFVDLTDQRNKIVKKELEKLNFQTNEMNFERAKEHDVFIFSPAKKWSESEIKNLANGTLLFCGNVPENLAEILRQKQIRHINFLSDEKFAIQNANLTAEGVLALILEKSSKSIFENNILIFGFGRISKALSILFLKLGVKFKIASFGKQSFEQSFFVGDQNYFGFEFENHLKDFDILINTRPEKFLNEKHLKNIQKNALFFETASVDSLDVFENMNFEFVKAPSLPQKFSPQSAAKVVLDKILGELET